MSMKWVAVLLMLINIGWNVFLEILDSRSLKNAIPLCVQDVYQPEEYQKWRAYKREKKRIGVYSSIVGYIVSMLLIVLDCYAGFAGIFPQNVYLQILSVILLSTLVSTVTGIPFSAYNTFVIEEKYGFNRSTVKTFVLDEVKELVIGLVLEGGLISLFAALHQAVGDLVILLFAGAVILLGFVLSLLSPVLTRIFNKFKPLEEGELKDKLVDLMNGHGYKVRAGEVMDASRRSSRMNAYFTGIGPMKTIVLFDTLREAMSDDEICAIFAHEMGHGLHHDIVFNRLFSALESMLMAVAAWLVVSRPEIFADFGFTGVNYGFAFILMGYLLSLLSPALGLLTSIFSRRAEYRADAQAVKEGYGPALVSSLKLLAKKNFADLSPDPLLVKLLYSHPTLAQRIDAIEKAENERDK